MSDESREGPLPSWDALIDPYIASALCDDPTDEGCDVHLALDVVVASHCCLLHSTARLAEIHTFDEQTPAGRRVLSEVSLHLRQAELVLLRLLPQAVQTSAPPPNSASDSGDGRSGHPACFCGFLHLDSASHYSKEGHHFRTSPPPLQLSKQSLLRVITLAAQTISFFARLHCIPKSFAPPRLHRFTLSLLNLVSLSSHRTSSSTSSSSHSASSSSSSVSTALTAGTQSSSDAGCRQQGTSSVGCCQQPPNYQNSRQRQSAGSDHSDAVADTCRSPCSPAASEMAVKAQELHSAFPALLAFLTAFIQRVGGGVSAHLDKNVEFNGQLVNVSCSAGPSGGSCTSATQMANQRRRTDSSCSSYGGVEVVGGSGSISVSGSSETDCGRAEQREGCLCEVLLNLAETLRVPIHVQSSQTPSRTSHAGARVSRFFANSELPDICGGVVSTICHTADTKHDFGAVVAEEYEYEDIRSGDQSPLEERSVAGGDDNHDWPPPSSVSTNSSNLKEAIEGNGRRRPNGHPPDAPPPEAPTSSIIEGLTHEIFRSYLGRVPHLTRCVAYHPEGLRSKLALHVALMTDPGASLLSPWKYFLGILASARHFCEPLARQCEMMFLAEGGDPTWLVDFSVLPEKLRRIQRLNRLLAHCPWRITPHVMRDLMLGTRPWAITELCLAILILTQHHMEAALSWGCGLLTDGDTGLPHVTAEPVQQESLIFQDLYDDPVYIAAQQQSGLESRAPGVERSDGNEHGPPQTKQQPPQKVNFAERVVRLLSLYPRDGKWDDLSPELQKSIFVKQEGGTLTQVMNAQPRRRTPLCDRFRQRGLSAAAHRRVLLRCTEARQGVPTVGGGQNSRRRHVPPTGSAHMAMESTATGEGNHELTRASSCGSSPTVSTAATTNGLVDEIGGDGVPSGGAASEKTAREVFVVTREREEDGGAGGEDDDDDDDGSGLTEDDKVAYVDFNMKAENYANTCSTSTSSDSCHILLDCYQPEISAKLRQVVDFLLHHTNHMVGDVKVPTTRPLRIATWHYAQRLYGVEKENYSYQAMNNFLSLRQKVYLKKLVCLPERITAADCHRLRETFSALDVVHFALIAAQSRQIATLNYAFDALSKAMTK